MLSCIDVCDLLLDIRILLCSIYELRGDLARATSEVLYCQWFLKEQAMANWLNSEKDELNEAENKDWEKE